MSALALKTAKISSRICSKNNSVLYAAIRNHWNKDFKPAPLPKTEEERRAAAAKYNLHPAEYQTYPDDGSGLGDYPKLPDISAENKDPFYPWDMPEIKKNFNEPMHADADLIGEDRINVNQNPRVPIVSQVLWFSSVIIGGLTIYYLCDYFRAFPGLTQKQYARDGKVHYTFEPNN